MVSCIIVFNILKHNTTHVVKLSTHVVTLSTRYCFNLQFDTKMLFISMGTYVLASNIVLRQQVMCYHDKISSEGVLLLEQRKLKERVQNRIYRKPTCIVKSPK